MTPEEFRAAAHALVDWIADHRERIPELPVAARVKPGRGRGRPRAGAPPRLPSRSHDVLADLERVVVPGITQTQSPHFFGWFPSNASLASVLGDIASSGIGALGITWQSAPALTEVEEVVVEWLRELTGLSGDWHGVIQDTASTGILVAMLAARERATGYSGRRGGLQGEERPLVVYTTPHAHSSIAEGGRCSPASAPGTCGWSTSTRSPTRCAPTRCAAAMDDDAPRAGVPAAVVVSVGTTGTTAVDPLAEIVADRAPVTAPGCTSTPRWRARRCCCRRCATSSTASRAPTRSAGTRTSGWARSSTAPCSTCATPSTWSG